MDIFEIWSGSSGANWFTASTNSSLNLYANMVSLFIFGRVIFSYITLWDLFSDSIRELILCYLNLASFYNDKKTLFSFLPTLFENSEIFGLYEYESASELLPPLDFWRLISRSTISCSWRRLMLTVYPYSNASATTS